MCGLKITKIIMEKIDFLKSIRFWKVVIIAILVSLQINGYIDEGVQTTIVMALDGILAGSVGIRTVDRFSEKISPFEA